MEKDWTGNKNSVNLENFYDIPSFKGRLKINKKGEVYSLISNKILKTTKLPNGYITITLMLKKPRKTKTLYLHRLIAETFIPNPENKKTVNHINGIKNDNRIENLEWATQSENNIHALNNNLRKSNTSKILEYNKLLRKLNEHQVIYIKSNLNKTVKEICNELNLNYNEYKYCIYDIKRGRTYKNE